MNFFRKIGVSRYRLSFVFSRKLKNKTSNVPVNVPVKLKATDYKVLRLLKKNSRYKREEMASILKLHTKTVQRAIKRLSDNGKIIRRDSDKSGYWEIVKNDKE